MTIKPEKDAMGTAVKEYFETKTAAKLRVLSIMFDEDEIPVPYLFRTFEEMPPLEQKALSLAKNKILDVGACAGCHALYLQEQGLDVCAIDISKKCCDVMKSRGIKNVLHKNIMDDWDEKFDTILLLMNGLGIASHLKTFPQFLRHLKSLLNPGGKIIMDSTDLKYLFDENDENAPSHFSCEVDFKMVYKNVKGESFKWLYMDFPKLQKYAKKENLKCELLMENEDCSYLAALYEN